MIPELTFERADKDFEHVKNILLSLKKDIKTEPCYELLLQPVKEALKYLSRGREILRR